MSYSELLIGNVGNNKNKFSSKLIGNVKDKDKDGYVSGFSNWVDDCNDNNKNQDGWLGNVGKAIVNIIKPSPPPTQTIVPQKSTIISPPPQAPNMPKTITTPNGVKINIPSTPTPTQTPSQFTPSTQTPVYSGGGGRESPYIAPPELVKQPQSPFTPKETGSYDTSTGVYTSPEGVKQSIPISNVPAGTTQVYPNVSLLTPQQRMSQQMQNYNQIVKQTYENQLKNYNVQNKLTQENFFKAGTYNPKTSEIIINPIYPFQGATTAHEVGHRLDLSEGALRDYSKYKEASSNLVPDVLENIGYKKGTVQYEYYARAFANYMKDPAKFRSKYPEIADEFERKLNLPIEERGVYFVPQTSTTQKVVKTGEKVFDFVTGRFEDIEKGLEKGGTQVADYLGLKKSVEVTTPIYKRETQTYNPFTKQYEIPESSKIKTDVPTATGSLITGFSKVPEASAMIFFPEVYFGTYAAKSGLKALDTSKTTSERYLSAGESVLNIGFGFGGRALKYIPKSIGKSLSTEISAETTSYYVKPKVPITYDIPIATQEIKTATGEVGERTFYLTQGKMTGYPKSIDVFGQSPEELLVGQKTTLTKQTPLNRLLKKEPEVIYEGVPYTDKEGYKKAVNELVDSGLTEKQAKEVLRYSAPKVPSIDISGVKTVTNIGEETSLGLTGTIKVYPAKLNERTKGFAPYEKVSKVGGTPEDIFGLEGIKTRESQKTIYSKDNVLFSKLSSKPESYTQAALSRQVGEQKIFEIKTMSQQTINQPMILESGEVVSKGKYGDYSFIPSRSVQLENKNIIELNPIESSFKVSEDISSLRKPIKRTSKEIESDIRNNAPEIVKTLKRIYGEKDTVTLYHGTTESAKEKILKEGLLPQGTRQEVYTGRTIEEVKGFGGRAVQKTGFTEQPSFLKIELPKSEYERLKVKRAEGIGGVDETTLQLVPKEYIQEVKQVKAKTPEKIQFEFNDLVNPPKIKETKIEIPKPKSYSRELIGSTGSRFSGLSVEGRLSNLGVQNSERIKIREETGTVLVDLPKNKEKIKDTFGVSSPQSSREELIQINPQQEKLRQRQENQLRTPLITPTINPPRNNFIFPEEQFNFIPITPIKTKEKKKKLSKKYIAELRRRGKFQEVSKPTSLSEAIGIGIQKAKTTLGASFRIIESDTGKSVGFNLSSPEFRPSKKERGVAIQKPSFRLGSIFERKEIQRAKSSKRNSFGF